MRVARAVVHRRSEQGAGLAYAAARGLVLCDDITCSLRALSRLLACRVEPGELSANQIVSLSRVVCPVRSRLQ